ncbi:mCG1050924 [Mus musculus]|uniref:Uncharacterized protein n=1 Tax=Mus musculus TaxID=10090 RepID=Q6R5H2_MOUSE|nr:unknown [Mus musculus]EDL01450.1 mCG1050924 [Mus musculus]
MCSVCPLVNCCVCCGCEHVDHILLNQNQKSPSLDYLSKLQLLYCIWYLTSILMFSLNSIFFEFLRVSTEMWQRIKLFLQTVLNHPVPHTGLCFFFIDLKFQQCSEATLFAYSITTG